MQGTGKYQSVPGVVARAAVSLHLPGPAAHQATYFTQVKDTQDWLSSNDIYKCTSFRASRNLR